MALSIRLPNAVTSWLSLPRTEQPVSPPVTTSLWPAAAASPVRSTASRTTRSTVTDRGSGSGSAPCSRERSISSCTSRPSRSASWRIRPAKRRTAGSSQASEIASASRDSAPTGVLSSWLTLATKSRRAVSTRRGSVMSSTRMSTSPPRGSRVNRTFTAAGSRLMRPLGRSSSTSRGGEVLILVEDITEPRRVETARRDFVANVSHELKTPVGALSLLAEAISDACDEPAAVRRFAGRMRHEADRLGRLVQELIDLSRLQGADPLPEPRSVTVDRVVREAVDRTGLAAAAGQIEVVTGGDTGCSVLGSESQLVTALGNLIDNAIAYSPPLTRVTVGVRRHGDTVEIAITDEGIGIAESDLERVFERFYRADPARSRATGGTGLGLAIVKHVATNHGGSVQVWSVEGSGSTFTLRLPALAAAPTARPVAAGTATPASSAIEEVRT